MFKTLRILTNAGLVLWAVEASAQSPQPQMLSAARQDVGFVIATACADGSERSGTAFVWPQSDQVITARHVVAGCQDISVQFYTRGRFTATPMREIRAQDLIALRLDSASGAAVQTLTNDPPPVHSKVAVVGFALGAPTADDKLLTVTTGNLPPPARLEHLLPNAERQLIRDNGPWDLDTAILRLDGNLTHGHSGAPIFDHQGRVVAVGAGGLQSGATGIVWAVNASYLMSPGNWRNVAAGQAIQPENNLTFSVQPPQAQLRQANCGSFTLSLSRTSSFNEIAAIVDDPDGLWKVRNAVGYGVPIDFEAMRFDIWEDLETGAVVPLPQGRTPQQSDRGCMVNVGSGTRIWIRSYDGSDDPGYQMSIQNVSLQLENDIGNSIGPNVYDPAFTYTYPLARADGFMANRKGVLGPVVPVDQARSFQNYGFVSHVGRGGHYLGVAALRQQSVVDYYLVNQCLTFGDSLVCDQALAPLHDWAVAALSVHMSTMPPI